MKIKGVPRFPSSADTCRGGGIIDGAASSTCLAGILEDAEALTDFPLRSHRPFRLRFKASQSAFNPLVEARVVPRSFPRQEPSRPSREHITRTASLQASVGASLACCGVSAQADVERAFSTWVPEVEEELCYIYDAIDQRGAANKNIVAEAIRIALVVNIYNHHLLHLLALAIMALSISMILGCWHSWVDWGTMLQY